MQFSKPERTDLIINMTLAEIFLLLLFVVWYGHTTIPDTTAPLKEENARLKNENENLTKDLKLAKENIANLEFRLNLWRELTGFENPPSLEVFTEWRKEACRSHPKCEQSNIALQATVINGQIAIKWLNECPSFLQWLKNSRRSVPKIGIHITDMKEIRAILTNVNDYYYSMKLKDSECRFDYILSYESKDDYYDGRELFERYFYPMVISRVRPNLNK